MGNDKILIGTPITEGKNYSLGDFFLWIAQNTYKNYDVAMGLNGKYSDDFVAKLQATQVEGKDLILLKATGLTEYSNVNQRLCAGREIIRQYAVKNDYDYIFWLDSDTFPFYSNAIELLLERKKPFVCGWYLYKRSKIVVAFGAKIQAKAYRDLTKDFRGLVDKKEENGVVKYYTNVKLEEIEQAFKDGELIPIVGAGYGCCLMSREIFEKYDFSNADPLDGCTDDIIHCKKLLVDKVPMWLDPRVGCKHVGAWDYEKNGEQRGTKG